MTGDGQATEGQPIAKNAYRLLWAGFMAILAAGVGFAIRGGILGQWANEFGFTMTELGNITGGGLTGFGIVIILSSIIADKIGYGKLMFLAFLLHFTSAVVTLAAPYAFSVGGKTAAYNCLYWGMFIFAIANGLCEAVVNPLVATLFPKNKTHFLNILHAGWPAGLVIGGLSAFFMAENEELNRKAVDWKIQMSLFLVPVIIYGAMLIGQKFPKSEAASSGVSFGKMFSTLFAPLMLFLIVIHAMVGYVELGTDSWISKITGTIMANKSYGLALMVYTSMLMFTLRFVAGPIVHKISPLGLLFVSSILGYAGLTLLGNATSVAMCVIAATVYACGKTFLWPTMLAIASERFPQGGAISIGMLGGVGMLSAGLLGTPAIGFKQDYFATQNLTQTSTPAYDRYKVSEPRSFLHLKVVGLDGAKVGILTENGKEKELYRDQELAKKNGVKNEYNENLIKWWEETGKSNSEKDKPLVEGAYIYGGKKALQLTAYIPATMGVCYLLLILAFAATGGYKPLTVDDHKPTA